MSQVSELLARVNDLISRHPETSLSERWQDANNLGYLESITDYWIRDTPDLINIAWLSPDTVVDITWFPSRQMSTLVSLPLRYASTIEIRQAPGAASSLGLGVSGDTVVTVNANPQRAGLIWAAAESDESDADLRRFLLAVAKAIH